MKKKTYSFKIFKYGLLKKKVNWNIVRFLYDQINFIFKALYIFPFVILNFNLLKSANLGFKYVLISLYNLKDHVVFRRIL